jgi:hypothetical protein
MHVFIYFITKYKVRTVHHHCFWRILLTYPIIFLCSWNPNTMGSNNPASPRKNGSRTNFAGSHMICTHDPDVYFCIQTFTDRLDVIVVIPLFFLSWNCFFLIFWNLLTCRTNNKIRLVKGVIQFEKVGNF